MASNAQLDVYNFVKKQSHPVTVSAIKEALHITESNVVEKAVLKNLNEGYFAMTPEGFKARA